MLILAILVSILLDGLAIYATSRVLGSVDNPFLRWGSILFSGVLLLTSIVVIASTTVTVRTMVVMHVMARQEPLATIMASDRQMRIKLEKAVREGLTKQTGPLAENVKASVLDVVKPYMAYRLSHASDRFVILSAKATRDMLRKARTEGTATCAAVVAGDPDTMRRLGGADATATWLPDLIRSDALDIVERATPQETAIFLQENAARSGISSADMVAATRRQGPAACSFPVQLIEDALRLPSPKDARMLRGLGYGGQAVTK